MDTTKTGAKYAIIVGLPTSFMLCLSGFPLSHFYPFAYILKLASLRIFWNPIVWVILAATITVALWQSGKAIANSLTRRDVLKTSFYFTSLVNIKLLIITAAIYLGGIINDWAFNVREIFLPAIPYAILCLLVFFALSTLVLSVTVSLAIVQLTKNKLKIVHETNNQADQANVSHDF